jgi:hypothetical protein
MIRISSLPRASVPGKYDIAIRVAAVREPIFAKAVRRVDAQRFGAVKPLFHELGFRGNELTARTRVFVTFGSLEHGMTKLPSKAERIRQIEALYKVLVGR